MIKYFEVEQCDLMDKMAEICFISAKIGLYTNLRDPILTNYTIFRNFRTGKIRWNASFYNLQTSKISFYKGPPLQIWPSQKWPLFSKTEITNIFVSMNFYSPWVIEQENPNIDDGYFMWILNFWIVCDSLWRFPRSFREYRRVLEIFWDFLRFFEIFG